LEQRWLLAEESISDSDRQERLSLAYDKLAELRQARGDRAGALQARERSLVISEALATELPNDLTRQRNLSIGYNAVGDALDEQGDVASALSAYRKGLAIREGLVAAYPDKPNLRRDLNISYDRVGRALRDQGKLAEALPFLRQSLAGAQALAAEDETNAQYRDDLAYSIGGLSGLAYHYVLVNAYDDALKMADEAIALDPNQIWFHTNRAHALMMLGREDEARTLYLKYRGATDARPGSSWNELVITDFAEMRAAGIDHPLMREVESALEQTHEPAPDAAQANQTAQ